MARQLILDFIGILLSSMFLIFSYRAQSSPLI
jgi:hypothetical protein